MARLLEAATLLLLVGCTAVMGVPTEKGASAEIPRFDLMIALNYANPLRSYGGSSDCIASSSSSTWMGVNCSYVIFNFTTPNGDNIGHKVTANEKLNVLIESEGCPREAKNYYGPMNGANCVDTRVPGGSYDVNIFLVEHHVPKKQSMVPGVLNSLMNFMSL